MQRNPQFGEGCRNLFTVPAKLCIGLRLHLCLTSFDFMSMLGEIEDEMDVEIDQEEVVNIRTVQEAVEYLEKL